MLCPWSFIGLTIHAESQVYALGLYSVGGAVFGRMFELFYKGAYIRGGLTFRILG